jgi:3(or 17)beta-hydroxysteroid dehydrogenase
MGRVAGKIALITGAASGLGFADAKLLAEEGAKVVLTDVNIEKGEAAALELGPSASFIKHDVSSEHDWIEVISKIDELHGNLDILVNNAGVVVMSDPVNCTLEEFRFANRIMSEGVFLGMKYSMPLLKKNHGGSIVNMSSTASHLGYPIFFAYSAAKGAVRSMTKSMAIHCQAESFPVRCNSVHAGGIETPMVQFAQGRADEAPVDVPAQGVLPADSLGTPKDVASMILYLASDESRFVTGAEFLIDNGLLARPAM